MQEYLLDTYFELTNNFRVIKTTYELLNKTSDLKIPVHPAGQWLLDNMYIIENEYNSAKADIANVADLSLPSVKPYDAKEQIRILFMANEMVENNKGVIDDGIVSNYLKEFQKHTYITYGELTFLPVMLRVAIIRFIKRLCLSISNSELQKLKVEQKFSGGKDRKHASDITNKALKGFAKAKNDIHTNNTIKTSNTAYIEYLAYKLKDIGDEGSSSLEELRNEINKVGFTIDEAIEKEHDEMAKVTSLTSNAIISMKTISITNWGEVIVSANRIDEILREDYTSEYARCDHKTKDRYRNVVIKLAKKYRVSEMYIAKKAIECSNKFQKHVGHFLIGEDKRLLIKSLGKSSLGLDFKRNILRPLAPYIYILTIILFSIGLTVLADTFFVPYSGVLRVLIDILLFTYSVEISDKLVAYFVGKFVKPKSLPRFNFAKTISKESTTLITMPTLITSVDKLKKMIKKMEITYLANRSENMYYMLVGDCTSEKTETVELDEKIISLGTELINKLNQKYPSETPLFNFMYRKRVYSKGEECYMGWERKRGALTQLNSLLLGKLTEEQINSSMYLVHRELPTAKYVLTIDEDTSLSLNSAKELVAIISHPLNKAVLSKDGKTVKSGYGLIQPAIGLEIEAANKSIFSKVFGGFGGLDIYTNAISNVYQDLFGEAIYTGKGIYDIELFDKLVGNKVPENLILSHDLLEGSFLKTGLASDVEVQDGFPSNFIAYMKRNHRWFRGDMQIISWIVKPSGLNVLSRWKIFDNLRRELLSAWALLFMILSLFLGGKFFLSSLLCTFVTFNIGYILSIIDELIFGKNAERKQKQYIPVIYGIRANLLKMVENIITIPYKAWTVINAFTTSIYRMTVTKKKLLEWATADSVDKAAKDKTLYFYRNMWPCLVMGLAYIVYASLAGLTIASNVVMLIVGVFFLIAPYAAYIMSKQVIFEGYNKLNEKEQKEIREIGNRTWKYFDSLMTDINNYLPPDNFQENRRPKVAPRTSSTNIGYGLLAIVNAYDLGYISLETAIDKLYKTFATVCKLEKWNGHLYNWYNIRTLAPLRPRFISTVDSGNFIACLYVIDEFFSGLIENQMVVDNLKEKVNELRQVCQDLIKNTDFSLLYVKRKNIFSIGYNLDAGKLVDSYYDLLMSESRLTSLIAIAVSQVTSKHWFALGRSLVKIDQMKGLLSWGGTSFEYFMPNLFTKTYKYTLIDEALDFAITSQIKYAKSADVPWGISESAFAVQDNEQNYQYKAFGIPWLGLKRGLNDNMVVSPYSSLICLNYEPKKVCANIKHLKKYNCYSTYGFYEAIDFTKKHIPAGRKYELVKTYMAHHQGMILTSINNALNNEIIKNRFHANPNVDAADILLKERIPLSIALKESRHSKENKYKEESKEEFTSYIEYIKYDDETKAEMPRLGTHTNGRMSAILLDSGNNYLYYKNNAISKNRYFDNITMGNLICLTDRSTGKSWSTTLLPNLSTPDDYAVSFSLPTTKYIRKDGDFETTTEVAISPEYNVEIRKITVFNGSEEKKELVINTELELAMCSDAANIVHPAFNNLLIEENYDRDLDALIATKRSREEKDVDFFVYAKLIGMDFENEVQTEKAKLVKETMESAYTGDAANYPLCPVMSYRGRLIIKPHTSKTFYYLIGGADTKYSISHAIVNLTPDTIEEQIKLANQKENVLAKYLKLTPGKAAIYNKVISSVLFGKDVNKNAEKFWDKKYDQQMLWRFGVSGDLPIITVNIGKIEDSALVKELIKFMDYVKSRKIDLDIVILTDEELYSGEPIKAQLKSILSKVVYMSYTRGNIYVINQKEMNLDERELFKFISRYSINNVQEFLPEEQPKNKLEDLVD